MPVPSKTALAARVRLFGREGMICALLALLPAGCCSFGKTACDSEVVASRQLAYRGIDALQHGRNEQAADLLKQAVAGCPSDSQARAHYAEALWQQGNIEGSLAEMRKAYDLSGRCPLLAVRLGEMHRQQNNLAEALRLADEAIATNRQTAPAWALRGHVAAQRRQIEDAISHYHRALTLEPRFPEVQFALAELYNECDRPQRALSTLLALADQFPPDEQPPRLLLGQGIAYRRLGRYRDAEERLVMAAHRGGGGTVYLQLAEVRMTLGDTAGADLAAREALAHDPACTPARDLLARLDRQLEGTSASTAALTTRGQR